MMCEYKQLIVLQQTRLCDAMLSRLFFSYTHLKKMKSKVDGGINSHNVASELFYISFISNDDQQHETNVISNKLDTIESIKIITMMKMN